jgi:hypothetical protein
MAVYFIGSTELGAVKIGAAKNPHKRLESLQTSSPYELTLYLVIQNANEIKEKQLHELFKEDRLKGEWFKLSDNMIYYLSNSAVLLR